MRLLIVTGMLAVFVLGSSGCLMVTVPVYRKEKKSADADGAQHPPVAPTVSRREIQSELTDLINARNTPPSPVQNATNPPTANAHDSEGLTRGPEQNLTEVKDRDYFRPSELPAVAPSAPAAAAPSSLAAASPISSAMSKGALPPADVRFKTVPAMGTVVASSVPVPKQLKRLVRSENPIQLSGPHETPMIFDIPVTYNKRVKQWIRYFQGQGRSQLRAWMERSARYIPIIQYELSRANLPQDLVYVAMIESGFSTHAESHASAMGMWQFIQSTGQRYGLKVDWWLDERKDFYKSTRAAIAYMGDLYKIFGSWYLVAASYNMGENAVKRLIQRYGTNNFWVLADMGVLPDETKNYVPKILAAMVIAKSPVLYGFNDLQYHMPHSYEYFYAPGGTDIPNLAKFLGVSNKYLRELNPELTKGFIPRGVAGHKIRIPKGSLITVSQFMRLQSESRTY